MREAGAAGLGCRPGCYVPVGEDCFPDDVVGHCLVGKIFVIIFQGALS